MGTQQTIWTRAQLLEQIGVSKTVLLKLHAEGMPRIRVSERVEIYIKEDVIAWLRERDGRITGAAGQGGDGGEVGADAPASPRKKSAPVRRATRAAAGANRKVV